MGELLSELEMLLYYSELLGIFNYLGDLSTPGCFTFRDQSVRNLQSSEKSWLSEHSDPRRVCINFGKSFRLNGPQSDHLFNKYVKNGFSKLPSG